MPEIAQTLKLLELQRNCERFEIVALDSESTDCSTQALAEAGARVERIDPDAFRFGPARQKLFEFARGRVIVTLSQDAIPGGDTWLAEMTRPILEGRCDLVQSAELPPMEVQRLAQYHQSGTAYGDWPMPWVAISCSGLAISREAWAATGFGPVNMSEDKYLAVAARRLGYRMEINRAVPILHGHRYSARSLAKRAFNEGMGARATEGRYRLRELLHDLTRLSIYRTGASEVLKHRTAKLSDVVLYPVRPFFLWLGYQFGRNYWR